MSLQKYMKEKNCSIPAKIIQSLNNKDNVTPTEFSDKNDILCDEALHRQAGFTKTANGDHLVSMYCEMPDVTKEMINWWFWWHAKENIRYKLWFPGEHFGISYAKKDRDYFLQEKQPPFRANTHFPLEKIGRIILPLRIDFVSPEDFGFSVQEMKNHNVGTAVCGHVGVFGGLLYHTEMCHIFFEKDGGLLLVSRFWIGKKLKNKLLRKIILSGNIAEDMARHCAIEYRNLAKKLPRLYNEFGLKEQ